MAGILSPKFTSVMVDNDLDCVIKNDKNNNFNFKDSELKIDKVSFMEFNECYFYKIKASSNVFYNVQFVDVIFENCDFSNSNFEFCSFVRCEFKNTKLLGSNFFNSSFQDVLFEGSMKYSNFATNKFKKVCFSEAFLEDSRFIECKFSLVSFVKSNINRIDFTKCNLSGLDFSTCEFDDIKINPSDLRGIKLNSFQACIIARKLGIIIV